MNSLVDFLPGPLDLPAGQPLGEVNSCKRSSCRRKEQRRVGHDKVDPELLLGGLPVLVLEHVQEDFLALVEVPQEQRALLPHSFQLGEVDVLESGGSVGSEDEVLQEEGRNLQGHQADPAS